MIGCDMDAQDSPAAFRRGVPTENSKRLADIRSSIHGRTVESVVLRKASGLRGTAEIRAILLNGKSIRMTPKKTKTPRQTRPKWCGAAVCLTPCEGGIVVEHGGWTTPYPSATSSLLMGKPM